MSKSYVKKKIVEKASLEKTPKSSPAIKSVELNRRVTRSMAEKLSVDVSSHYLTPKKTPKRRKLKGTSNADVVAKENHVTKNGEIDEYDSAIHEASAESSENVSAIHEESNELENGGVTTCDVVTDIWSEKYVNVVERLNLDHTPKCFVNLDECLKHHYCKANNTSIANPLNLNEFATDDQPHLFLYLVQMNLLRGKIPDSSTMQIMLELILGVNKRVDNAYQPCEVIKLTASAFMDIVEKFPPCWMAANLVYRDLLTQSGKNLILKSDVFYEKFTLFENVLTGLDNLIRESSLGANLEESLNDSQDLQNFFLWESKHSQKFSFDKLHRDEKIDRLFLTLSLLVRLCEVDLAMWMLAHLNKPNKNLFDGKKGPLITSILWSNSEPNEINHRIKNILNVFVNYVSVRFPAESIQVLSRLISLVYNVFDLKELKVKKEHVVYPHELTKSLFCEALSKIIYEHLDYGVDLWVNVIHHIDQPRLKVQLVSALMTKIQGKNVLLDPQSIHQQLLQMEKNFHCYFGDKGSAPNSYNNNNSKVENQNAADDPRTHYPFLQKKRRRTKCSELTGEAHIELLLVSFKAYAQAFHLKDICSTNVQLKKQNQLKSGASVSSKKKITKRESFNQRLSVFEEMHSTDWEDKFTESNIFVDTLPNTQKCRNDAKFFDVVNDSMETLPKIRAKFGAYFE